jgi:hypothetical protein
VTFFHKKCRTTADDPQIVFVPRQAVDGTAHYMSSSDTSEPLTRASRRNRPSYLANAERTHTIAPAQAGSCIPACPDGSPFRIAHTGLPPGYPASASQTAAAPALQGRSLSTNHSRSPSPL